MEITPTAVDLAFPQHLHVTSLAVLRLSIFPWSLFHSLLTMLINAQLLNLHDPVTTDEWTHEVAPGPPRPLFLPPFLLFICGTLITHKGVWNVFHRNVISTQTTTAWNVILRHGGPLQNHKRKMITSLWPSSLLVTYYIVSPKISNGWPAEMVHVLDQRLAACRGRGWWSTCFDNCGRFTYHPYLNSLTRVIMCCCCENYWRGRVCV